MSNLKWCAPCNTHHWNNERCLPTFEVAVEWKGEIEDGSWIEVRAIDAETAAERWADQHDSGGDYRIVSGQYEPVVRVRDRDGVVTRWEVTGESVPSYSAFEAPAPTGYQGEGER